MSRLFFYLLISLFIFLIKFIESNLRVSINVSYASYGVPSQNLTLLNLLDILISLVFLIVVLIVNILCVLFLRRKKVNPES